MAGYAFGKKKGPECLPESSGNPTLFLFALQQSRFATDGVEKGL
jgi:hypothetical protein